MTDPAHQKPSLPDTWLAGVYYSIGAGTLQVPALPKQAPISEQIGGDWGGRGGWLLPLGYLSL